VHLAFYNMCEFCTMIPISLFITKIQNLKWGCKTLWRVLYNILHNKCKELLPIKPQFNLNKNPTWTRIQCGQESLIMFRRVGSTGPPLKNVMVGEECQMGNDAH
jgi:hypothetical protein